MGRPPGGLPIEAASFSPNVKNERSKPKMSKKQTNDDVFAFRVNPELMKRFKEYARVNRYTQRKLLERCIVFFLDCGGVINTPGEKEIGSHSTKRDARVFERRVDAAVPCESDEVASSSEFGSVEHDGKKEAAGNVDGTMANSSLAQNKSGDAFRRDRELDGRDKRALIDASRKVSSLLNHAILERMQNDRSYINEMDSADFAKLVASRLPKESPVDADFEKDYLSLRDMVANLGEVRDIPQELNNALVRLKQVEAERDVAVGFAELVKTRRGVNEFLALVYASVVGWVRECVIRNSLPGFGDGGGLTERGKADIALRIEREIAGFETAWSKCAFIQEVRTKLGQGRRGMPRAVKQDTRDALREGRAEFDARQEAEAQEGGEDA